LLRLRTRDSGPLTLRVHIGCCRSPGNSLRSAFAPVVTCARWIRHSLPGQKPEPCLRLRLAVPSSSRDGERAEQPPAPARPPLGRPASAASSGLSTPCVILSYACGGGLALIPAEPFLTAAGCYVWVARQMPRDAVYRQTSQFRPSSAAISFPVFRYPLASLGPPPYLGTVRIPSADVFPMPLRSWVTAGISSHYSGPITIPCTHPLSRRSGKQDPLGLQSDSLGPCYPSPELRPPADFNHPNRDPSNARRPRPVDINLPSSGCWIPLQPELFPAITTICPAPTPPSGTSGLTLIARALPRLITTSFW